MKNRNFLQESDLHWLKATSQLEPLRQVGLFLCFPAWLAVEMQAWMQFQAEQSSRKVLRLDFFGFPGVSSTHLMLTGTDRLSPSRREQHSSDRTITHRSCLLV